MYAGRIVAVARARNGAAAAMYRVSSRSYPNRQAAMAGHVASIVPKPGHEDDVYKNPYIAYNCLRIVDSTAIATNGSQTDPIAEKIAAGIPPRDALVSVLHALDYEHDNYSTPRIAAVISAAADHGYLGIVRHDAVLVQAVHLAPGEAFYVCTYEHDAPSHEYRDTEFDAVNASEACSYIIGRGVFADLERPITAACAVQTPDQSFEIAVMEAESAGAAS